MLDVRQDFPLLRNHPTLCYLDSAATSQKPDVVIQAITHFLSHNNANVRRGVHRLSDEADGAYQSAREVVANFIGAEPDEIIFTQNTTAAINLVARGYVSYLPDVKRIYTTNAEHNSNLFPWYHIGPRQEFDHQLQEFALIDSQAHIVAMTHLSNVLGQITPVQQVVKYAHAANVPVLVDAAQSIGHIPINVKELGCDFMAFSAHKMLSLTGIGVLYISKPIQDSFAPVFLGGGTVANVTKSDFTWANLPDGLEAGTPPIVEAVSLKAAIQYLNNLGLASIDEHIKKLTSYCVQRLLDIDVKILGGLNKHGLVSFNLDNIHPHDVAFELDKMNIAVRAGHHCAHICHQNFGVKSSVRASFHVYNTLGDVDRLIYGLQCIRQIFR